MARQALGDREQALASLARALELAEPGGWVRCFADEGAPMAKLLSAVLRSTVQRSAISRQRSAVGSQQQGRTVDPAYVARILAACEQGAHKGDASDAVGLAVSLTDFAHTGTERPSPTPHLQEVDALSARELEVLRLLTTHLSSTEIARELYVSKNTVRSHIGHIYDKLGAHSRAEAVARAKELGLL